MMRKILILAYDFPPNNTIGAQRPYSWYKYLKSFGLYPVVVTRYWDQDIKNPTDLIKPGKNKKDIIQKTEFGTIIKVPYKTNLRDKLILKYGNNKLNLIRKTLSFFYKIFQYITFYADNKSNIYKAAKQYIKKNNCDFIITTGEPFILFKYGYKLKKRSSSKWIADYRDGWYLNQLTATKKKMINVILRKWELYFEKKYIKTTDLITTVDPYLADKLKKLHHKTVKVVYNGFDVFYKHKTQAAFNKKLTLTHLGNLNPCQGVESFLDVVKELKDAGNINKENFELKFIGLEFYHDQYNRVMNYDKQISQYITTTSRISKDEALYICSQSDYLISLTDKYYTAIYAKTYDYISLKRPILLIYDDKSLLSNFINELNAGFVFHTKEQLIKFLAEKIEKKKNGESIPKSAIDIKKAAFYTRFEQAKLFVKFIRNL